MLAPTTSDSINRRASSQYRATVLSVASFLKAVPYVLLAPMIGFLNDGGNLQLFLIGWSVLILVALVLYTVAANQRTKLS